MSTEKQVFLTGGAAATLDPSSYKKRKNRKTRKYSGGDNSGALVQLAAQSAPAGYAAPDTQALAAAAQGAASQALAANFGPNRQWGQSGGEVAGATTQLASSRAPVIPGSPEPIPVTSGIPVSQPAPVAGGSRLVLTPHKRKTRIALRARKLSGGVTSANSVAPSGLQANLKQGVPLGGGTRKARKLHLRVKGVTARLAKAKKAKKEAENASLSVIKSRLEKAGVIKKNTKAPEKMLRTMYTDLLITKKGL